MNRVSKDRYEIKGWILDFDVRFSFNIFPLRHPEKLRMGVYYYTGRLDILSGNKLPEVILEAVRAICETRHKEGLMPNWS